MKSETRVFLSTDLKDISSVYSGVIIADQGEVDSEFVISNGESYISYGGLFPDTSEGNLLLALNIEKLQCLQKHLGIHILRLEEITKTIVPEEPDEEELEFMDYRTVDC
jgi:hypothetical protein